MENHIQAGDHVTIIICHRDHIGRVLTIIAGSEPTNHSAAPDATAAAG